MACIYPEAVIGGFVLERGSSNDPFESAILNIELRTSAGIVKYEAQSYEWKEATDDDPIIIVNDCEFRLRRNLYYALKSLRPLSENRYMWIDALCIDQKNNRERNPQVFVVKNI